jgi:hypothetical protein
VKKQIIKKNDFAFLYYNQGKELVQIKDISIFRDSIEYYVLLIDIGILYWCKEDLLEVIQNQESAKLLFNKK